MSRIAIALLLLILLVACDGSASAGPSSAPRTVEPATGVPSITRASEVPPDATTIPPPSEPSAPACPPPLRIAPRALAVSWPSYVGRRVSFACRAVRRIDFVRTVVVAEGARFVVTGPPDLVPCGHRSSTFTVIGSSSAPLAGRTVLPELLVDDGDGCAP